MILTVAALILLALFLLTWRLSIRLDNYSFVDVTWSLAFAPVALWYALAHDGWPPRRAAIGLLVAAWSLRLGLHLWRRVRGEGEDGRYAQLRKRWGNGALKWLAMFQFQALLIALFSLPFLAVAANPVAAWNAWFVAGIALWIGSVVGEGIADRQLQAFRSDPRNHGRVCDTGLWAWSRHPNYVFEWLHWWAYPLLWLVPLLTWQQAVTRVRNIAEHALIPVNGDPLGVARTTQE